MTILTTERLRLEPIDEHHFDGRDLASRVGAGSISHASSRIQARETSRHSFEPEVRAAAVRAYIRAGYE